MLVSVPEPAPQRTYASQRISEDERKVRDIFLSLTGSNFDTLLYPPLLSPVLFYFLLSSPLLSSVLFFSLTTPCISSLLVSSHHFSIIQSTDP